MIDDYIELTDPNEVIREGDFFMVNEVGILVPLADIGQRIKDLPKLRFRRPRSTVIRDAAEALLRAIEKRLDGSKPIIEPELSKLREALGLTIEELRREA